ncbi:hypothetical protein SmJEL517_g03587 [Synchytrium microbalum]|uniref:CRAL-TRIO domain-containing protein n=1 Tax=Synchytrium microbalum TaxID=1806994 RepID=A0A507C6K8_9FUNG|nr:uncharacterized protein SmJEL517_g03587 [Synchytrium microbalum]TPX33606.1 hypothetical protein SmJEL517_g03587 [Synchytrium microbalum]
MGTEPPLSAAMLAAQTGRVGNLTPEQETALAEFKSKLSAIGAYDPAKHSDHLLLRFLRARKFNLDNARKMWLDCEKWRKEFGIEELMKTFDFPEAAEVRAIYPRFYHKADKMGRPIYIERFEKCDLTKLWQVTTPDRMIRNHVYEYEKLINFRLQACSIKAGRHLEQSCTILDLKGVGLSSFKSVYTLVQQVSTISQNYYPEMLGRMFIVNAPFLFTGVWALVKPMLDEVTVNKISILGASYQEELLKAIEKDNLPDFLGGSCTCADVNGCTNADKGPWTDGTVEGYPKQEWLTYPGAQLKANGLKHDDTAAPPPS